MLGRGERHERNGHHRRPEECGPIRLWAMPKVIFFYPTMLFAILGGICASAWPAYERTWTLIFLFVFAANLLVISFDFTATSSLAWTFAALAALAGLVLVDQLWVPLLGPIGNAFDDFAPRANDQFYWAVAALFILVYAVIFLVTRHVNYWVADSNQLVHHRPWDTTERFPMQGMGVQKDLTDVFEFLLLRTGRLVLRPTNGPAIVLDHIHQVNHKEHDLQQLTSVLKVEDVDHDHVTGDVG